MAVRRDGYTLIELIFVVVIMAMLSVASYKGMEALKVRSFKSQQITKLSLESQTALNQIANLLQYRIPYSVIGYDPVSGDFKYIGDVDSDDNMTVLEWVGRASESFKKKDYSAFVDMQTKSGDNFLSPNTNGDDISDTIQKKYNISNNIYTDKIVNLIFAGSFDRALGSSNDIKESFGWHGNDSNDSFDIFIASDGNITLTDSVKPKFLYEKYFLVDGAYAVARGENIDQSADCLDSLHVNTKDMNDTLFLFYDYRPWKGETFCADPNGNQKKGKVTILAQHIVGFRFEEVDYTLRIYLDVNRSIRASTPVHISKMKVVF